MPGISIKSIRPTGVRRFNPGKIDVEARAGIRQYLNEVREEMEANYNDVEPTPTYQRRGYGRGGAVGIRGSWHVAVRSNNFGTLTNNAVDPRGRLYAVYVQGPRYAGRSAQAGTGQRSDFRGRGWKSISDVVRRTKKRYVEIMNRTVGPTRAI